MKSEIILENRVDKCEVKITYNFEQKYLTITGSDGSGKGYIGDIALKKAKELLLSNYELRNTNY